MKGIAAAPRATIGRVVGWVTMSENSGRCEVAFRQIATSWPTCLCVTKLIDAKSAIPEQLG